MSHVPVLFQEVVYSCPKDCKLIIDGTLGHGGHTSALSLQTQTLIGMDLDINMLNIAKQNLKAQSNIIFINDSYANIEKVVEKYGKADFVVLDLGVNMDHFKDGTRGFSIHYDADLDMRFDQSSTIKAFDIVNTYSIDQLTNIFVEYADFQSKQAHFIASHIVGYRKKIYPTPIQTTFDLKKILGECGLGKPAITVLFQAIRMQTNGEMLNLQNFLQKLDYILNPGGVCSIITFHSIEDRIVKKSFASWDETHTFKLVNKKVIKPNYKEVAKNRASRSAKLRVIQKI